MNKFPISLTQIKIFLYISEYIHILVMLGSILFAKVWSFIISFNKKLTGVVTTHKLWDLWLRNEGGYIHTYIYRYSIRTDQWISGHFSASGDHNIWFYVLNPVSNHQGLRFLPPRCHKMKLTFFISEIQALKVRAQADDRNTSYFILPISLHDIENIYMKLKNILFAVSHGSIPVW